MRFGDERLPVRFWAKVEDTGNCWLWLASLRRGYGQFRWGDRIVRPHILTGTLENGPCPANHMTDHLCREPRCVNPEHLEWVTCKVNLNRSPLHTSGRAHCPQGHPYNEENTQRRGGKRYCRICAIRHRLRWRERQRGTKGEHLTPLAF